MSPMEYLMTIRIKESKILLRTTNYSISQVADIVGFTTPTYFSKQFRKITGISPTDYREKYQKESQ